MSERVTIDFGQNGYGHLQASINVLDEDDAGTGYRLAGGKYDGRGKTLLRRTLTARDATEIRRALNRVFPEETS